MLRSRMIAEIAVAAFGLSVFAGCRSTAKMPQAVSPQTALRSMAIASSAAPFQRQCLSAKVGDESDRPSARATPVGHEDDVGEELVSRDADDPFTGQIELSLPTLVEAVKQRNPSLRAAYAAWSAAAQRYPQVIALDDPMFQSMYAPRTWNAASDVQSSYYFGVAQKFSWPGKRELRGQQANWESLAAGYDYNESQLRLAEAARLAFFDFYLNARQRELNDDSLDSMREFREIARAKYEANQATQNDLLQAEVELGKLEQRQIEFDQERLVAVARINTLLHRRPGHTLPPPPQSIPASSDLPSVTALHSMAEEQRPELQAMLARVQAEQYSVALACREYYPDLEVMARYDRFWIDPEQQPQIGLNINVPLNQSKRAAAVREAQARVGKMQAEYEQARDNIWQDVAQAFARVRGNAKSLRLFDSKLLPNAEQNLATAKTGYSAGTLDFLRVIDAQRQIIELREQQQMALVELNRRRAELERAVGSSLPEADVPTRDVPPAAE